MNTYQKRRLLAKRRAEKPSGKFVPILIYLTLTAGVLGTAAVAAGLGAMFFVYNSYASDYVPIQDKLRLTNAGLTEIWDRGGPTQPDGSGGVLLGSLTNPDAQLLDPVKLSEISPFMIQATVSTEDNTFYDNPGVNITGLMRAGFEYFTGGLENGTGTGGSSITQQLIKNVYICPSVGDAGTDACSAAPRTLDRKLREIAYALELEHDSTKDQVLEWYLNQISYADRYVGVQAAAQGYFHKNASDLTLAEAALLAGIPQSPTEYHPRLNCAKDAADNCIVDDQGRTLVVGAAKQRQEDVLDLMVVHNRATKADVDAAKAEPVSVYQSRNDLKASAFIDDQVEPRLERMCNAGLLKKLDGAADCRASVHSAGYKVTTSLDYAETQAAEGIIQQYITSGLAAGCNCNNAAIVTIEPSSGQLLIYAPNRDPSNVSDPRVAGDVDQLTEINQPGSSFKPIVYLNYFETAHKAPMSTFWDSSPLHIENTDIVNPRSDARKTEGLISARAAMGGSQNVGAFRAAAEGGVDNVISMAKTMGITTLQQGFDPTFRDHEAVTYGASIATGGANIRAVDMAYVDTVIANMGVMVGTPTLAKTIDPKDLRDTANSVGADYDEAIRQAREFARGNIRLPGTRELDPIVVLQVRDHDGNLIYTEPAPQKKQVVNAGSVWLVHSIMSDCTARFIIWTCGSSDDDNNLDFIFEGKRVPGGVKTGTQQGANINDTLETWMTGYTRYAGTAVWVGNATNELVHDGPQYNYASADTTYYIFKHWMTEYHRYLKAQGVFDTPATFDELQPKNVTFGPFKTPSTDRVLGNGGAVNCDQRVNAWYRTDVTYEDECTYVTIDSRNGLLATDQTPSQYKVSKGFRRLPTFSPESALELAKSFPIPLPPTERSSGQGAVEVTNPKDGAFISGPTTVTGNIALSNVKSWKLELGTGSAPTDWKQIGSGSGKVDGGTLGQIDTNGLADGVYTIRLTADDGTGGGGVSVSVSFNVRRGSPSPTASVSPSPRPSGTPQPSRSPSPGASSSTGPGSTTTPPPGPSATPTVPGTRVLPTAGGTPQPTTFR